MKSKIIAVIPARHGSKRLPGKNTMLMCGEPLITHTLRLAIQCEFFDNIIITSDDLKIFRIYTNEFENDPRVSFVFRPEDLACDETLMWEVVEHACSEFDQDTIVVLLQPTSPLREIKDITNALSLFNICKKFGVVGVSWEYPDHEMRINGAIYINYLGTIVNSRSFIYPGTLVYVMPKNKSIDIDTIDDFVQAEMEMYKDE